MIPKPITHYTLTANSQLIINTSYIWLFIDIALSACYKQHDKLSASNEHNKLSANKANFLPRMNTQQTLCQLWKPLTSTAIKHSFKRELITSHATLKWVMKSKLNLREASQSALYFNKVWQHDDVTRSLKYKYYKYYTQFTKLRWWRINRP